MPAGDDGGWPSWVLRRGPSERHFRSLADEPIPPDRRDQWTAADWRLVRAARRWADELRQWRQQQGVSHAVWEQARDG